MQVNKEDFLFHYKEIVNTSSHHGLGFRESEIDAANREKFIKGFNKHNINIIKTARQTGSTTMLATLVAILNIHYPDKLIYFIAPRLDSGLHFLNLVEKIYGGKLPGRNEKYYRGNVRAVSAASEGMKAYKPDLVIFDQAVYLKNFEDLFDTYSRSSDTKIMAVSTPGEPKGKFYDIYDGALNHSNDSNPITLHSYHKEGTPGFDQMMNNYLYNGSWRNELLGEFLKQTRAKGSKIINVRIDEELNEILEKRILDLAVISQKPLTMSDYLRNLIIKDLQQK